MESPWGTVSRDDLHRMVFFVDLEVGLSPVLASGRPLFETARAHT